MQNPFRHQDEPDRPDRDDQRWEGRDRRPEEYRTWGGGDGGRSAEAFRNQGYDRNREQSGASGWGYGQNQQSQYGQGMSTPYTGDRGPAGPYGPGGYQSGPQYGQDYGSMSRERYEQRSFNPSGGSQGQTYGGGSFGGQYFGGQAYDRGYGASSWGQPMGSQNYGQTYGGQGGVNPGYASHAYAPGSQIWEGSGRGMGGQSQHHDFEPDYLHWREQQLSAFDKDYSDWRNERRQKFSSEFDTWRQSRPRSEASGQTQAENPIVGDVSDGGTGSSAEVRKR